MTQVLKNKKGVTLVELLAVIVILGIIAAIAVPAIGGLISNTEKKAAETTYSNIVDAARLYKTSEQSSSFTLDDMVTKGYISIQTGYITQGETGGSGGTAVANSAVSISINASNVVTISVTVTGTNVVYFSGTEMDGSGTPFVLNGSAK